MMLNRNFQSTKEAETLERAGVLLRTADSYEHPDFMWEMCPETLDGHPAWCAKYNDRVPVSLVNRAHTAVYKHGSPGMVVAPRAVRMMCAYYSDGSSQSKSCNPPSAGCVPGCGPWCRFEKDWGCSWRPEQLPQMLQQFNHFNHGELESEIILDPGDSPVTPFARMSPPSYSYMYVYHPIHVSPFPNQTRGNRTFHTRSSHSFSCLAKIMASRMRGGRSCSTASFWKRTI